VLKRSRKAGESARVLRRRDGPSEDGVARSGERETFAESTRRRRVFDRAPRALTRACLPSTGSLSRMVDLHRTSCESLARVVRFLLTSMVQQHRLTLAPLVAFRDGHTALVTRRTTPSAGASLKNHAPDLPKSPTGLSRTLRHGLAGSRRYVRTRGPGQRRWRPGRADAESRRCPLAPIPDPRPPFAISRSPGAVCELRSERPPPPAGGLS